jgi:hypothetical protein
VGRNLPFITCTEGGYDFTVDKPLTEEDVAKGFTGFRSPNEDEWGFYFWDALERLRAPQVAGVMLSVFRALDPGSRYVPTTAETDLHELPEELRSWERVEFTPEAPSFEEGFSGIRVADKHVAILRGRVHVVGVETRPVGEIR